MPRTVVAPEAIADRLANLKACCEALGRPVSAKRFEVWAREQRLGPGYSAASLPQTLGMKWHEVLEAAGVSSEGKPQNWRAPKAPRYQGELKQREVCQNRPECKNKPPKGKNFCRPCSAWWDQMNEDLCGGMSG